MFKKALKYTPLPFFFILTLLLYTGCVKEETNSQNHLPKATYEVDTYRGDVSTVFQFDASMVSDEEDAVELLEIRWDWNNNGVYDTEYSTTKMITHQYTEAGLYFPLLKVRDTKGMIDSIKKMVVVVFDIENLPPRNPNYISPVNWQEYTAPKHVFKWTCTDPDDEELSFDFWLGSRASNLSLLIENIETEETIANNKVVYSATIPGLQFNQDYYWQIYAHDAAGNYTAGEIWKFTTSPE